MWHRTAAPLMGPGPWVPPRARKRRVGGEGERDVGFGSPPTVFFFFFSGAHLPLCFFLFPLFLRASPAGGAVLVRSKQRGLCLRVVV